MGHVWGSENQFSKVVTSDLPRPFTLYKGNLSRLVVQKLPKKRFFRHCHENKSCWKLNFELFWSKEVHVWMKIGDLGLGVRCNLPRPEWVGFDATPNWGNHCYILISNPHITSIRTNTTCLKIRATKIIFPYPHFLNEIISSNKKLGFQKKNILFQLDKSSNSISSVNKENLKM